MLGGRCCASLVLGLVLLAALPQRTEAVNPETLLMPGKLSTAHAKYEEQCTQCHDRSDRNRQTHLCLDCHKEIAADLAHQRGFHGRLRGIETSQCRACHSEHLGRAGDIVKLNRDEFDHEGTDYPLRGAHLNATCESCHAAGTPFRKTPVECIGCHGKVEPHDGRLGRDCAACHKVTVWRDVTFNHDKTQFQLKGKHTDAPCVSCHFGNRYKDTPRQCVSCHAADDVHHGERGPKCADCHAPSGWKTASFDHGKETDFPLKGVHAHVDCRDCHRTGNLHDKLPRDCFGCHQGQDAHAGRLGTSCETCHDNEKWKPSLFDHSRDTRWALTGRHAKLECHLCHTAVVASQKLSTDCVSCHRASDAHAGRLGTRCDECHSADGWRVGVSFDHDLSKFPLLGQHVAVPCEQCHLTRQYRDVGHACIDCHAREDIHKGSLGKECAGCHSPNGWSSWEFDHGKQTGFALSGAHRRLTCSDCHKQPADRVKLGSTCISCHANDDVHLGQYGHECQRCHSDVTFKGARVQ